MFYAHTCLHGGYMRAALVVQQFSERELQGGGGFQLPWRQVFRVANGALDLEVNRGVFSLDRAWWCQG